MAQVIQFDFAKANSGVIDIATVQQSCRKLKAGLIAPAAEEVKQELASEHAAEPIKDMNDIIRISQFLIGQLRYRDNMLFIVGINFGLRVSDLAHFAFPTSSTMTARSETDSPFWRRRPRTQELVVVTATSPSTRP